MGRLLKLGATLGRRIKISRSWPFAEGSLCGRFRAEAPVTAVGNGPGKRPPKGRRDPGSPWRWEPPLIESVGDSALSARDRATRGRRDPRPRQSKGLDHTPLRAPAACRPRRSRSIPVRAPG
jgi:hypothetical protein